MKKFLAILLALVLVIGLAACGTPSNTGGNNTNTTPAPSNDTNNAANENTTPAPAPVAEKKVLRVATKGDPTSLMHALVTVASFNTPAQQIMMDRLFDYDGETGTYVPMLAEKAEQIDDAGLRYRFTLRGDVKSWNGDKFTASDVLYTIKAVVDGGQQARYFGNFDVENCKVEDDTHFVLALKKPDPFILTTLSNIPYGMMVEASVKAGGGLENMTGNGGKMPNCYTGPYIPVKWEEGSQVVFEKNKDYWGGEPYFDEVVLISIKDATARVEALEGGSVDLALEPAEDMVPAIQGNSKLTILSKATTNHHTLFLNTQKAPFDDVHARRAFAMALDYDSNIAMALNGYGKHSDSILPVGNPQYYKPDNTYYKYDLKAAVEELKQSKYAGNMPEINLLVMPSHSAYATLIQQQWDKLGKEAGVTITVKIDINQNEFYNRIQDDKDVTQCWIVNNSNPNPYEQLKFYDSRFTPAELRGGPRWEYETEKVYGLFDKITSEPIMDKATPYYKELVDIINDQIPSIPIYVPDRLAYSVNNLDGIGLTEVGDINFAKSFFK